MRHYLSINWFWPFKYDWLFTFFDSKTTEIFVAYLRSFFDISACQTVFLAQEIIKIKKSVRFCIVCVKTFNQTNGSITTTSGQLLHEFTWIRSRQYAKYNRVLVRKFDDSGVHAHAQNSERTRPVRTPDNKPDSSKTRKYTC